MMVFWAFPPGSFQCCGGMYSLQLQGDSIWFMHIAMTRRRNCIDYRTVSRHLTKESYTEETDGGTCTKLMGDECYKCDKWPLQGLSVTIIGQNP
jgi:hypothetical protein